jgi:hypothetical protein
VLGEQVRAQPVDEHQRRAARRPDTEVVVEPLDAERGGEGGRDVGQRAGGGGRPERRPAELVHAGRA